MPKNKNYEVHPIHSLMSKNIIRLRRKAGLTQIELSKKTGLTHNFINDLENGKKGVSAESIRKLSKALNAEPFQLFMPTEFHKNETYDKIKKYIDKFAVVEKELDKMKEYSIFVEN